jgi:hypothetical protein
MLGVWGRRASFGLIGFCAFAGGAWAQVANLNATVNPPAAMPLAAPIKTTVFPLSEVRRGLHGVAYTVFEGVAPEPMEVEILGVLKDAIGPGQDMILARLKGEKPEYTGVVAGMSGSPVYVAGRLVGALSYRIGQFAKEPICGITPIEQMFEVRDGRRPAMRVAGAGENRQQQGQNVGVSPLRRQGASPSVEMTASTAARNASAGGEIEPIATPLVFGGFSREAVERFGETFRAMGMEPVAGLGGAAVPGTKQPEPIVPGSAVSAVLVRGDLSISGTCTVTYVDPTQLLACGHPITQFGPVEMPMTKAEVVATLASPLNAFKIINTTETVGSFTEDRASAILGQFGTAARMIPVEVEVVPGGSVRAERTDEAKKAGSVRGVSMQVGGSIPMADAKPSDPSTGPAGHPMHFEVLDNRQLTPSAMLVSVYQSLSGTNASANEMSYRMTGELTLKGLPPVKMQGVMAPSEFNSGAVASALYVNERFGRLYDNAVEQPTVTGLHLRMETMPERRTAVLEGARIGKTEVRAGETVDVEATVHPYQAEAQVMHLAVQLPATLTPGPLRIVISDGATVDRLITPQGSGGSAGAAAHPLALADAVAQLNRSHANDRVYVTLLDHTAQAVLDAESLPGVPLSMANVLEPLKVAQKMQLTGESVVEAGSAETGYAVTGSQVLTVIVR